MKNTLTILHRILVCGAFLFSCLGVSGQTPALEPLAREVTIYRDTYGVPHVFGKTDAAAVFGFAYAQAEDNFWRLEENYIAAIGRSAEIYGERRLERDRVNRIANGEPAPPILQAQQADARRQQHSACQQPQWNRQFHPGSVARAFPHDPYNRIT